jgi:hypothetical protein
MTGKPEVVRSVGALARHMAAVLLSGPEVRLWEVTAPTTFVTNFLSRALSGGAGVEPRPRTALRHHVVSCTRGQLTRPAHRVSVIVAAQAARLLDEGRMLFENFGVVVESNVAHPAFPG